MLDIKLLLASLCLGVGAVVMPPKGPSTITVAGQSPAGAGVPLEAFVSYSIEFSSFPDFAGMLYVHCESMRKLLTPSQATAPVQIPFPTTS